MKKYLPFLVIVLLLAACAPSLAVQQGAAPGNMLVARFVELPQDVQDGITGLVLVVVSLALAFVIAKIPFLAFLEQFRLPLASAIAFELITWLQNILPSAYPDIAVMAIRLVLAVVAIFVTFQRLGQRGVKGFALFNIAG